MTSGLIVLLAGLLAGDESIACGPACISLAARLEERIYSREQISNAFSGRMGGEHDLRELRAAAESLGLATQAASIQTDCCDLCPRPLIIAVRPRPGVEKTRHFVVLYGRTERGVQVLDPPRHPRFVSPWALRQVWDGDGFYVAANSGDLSDVVAARKTDAWLTFGGGGLLLVCSFVALFWTRRSKLPG